MKIKGAGT